MPASTSGVHLTASVAPLVCQECSSVYVLQPLHPEVCFVGCNVEKVEKTEPLVRETGGREQIGGGRKNSPILQSGQEQRFVF